MLVSVRDFIAVKGHYDQGNFNGRRQFIQDGLIVLEVPSIIFMADRVLE